MTNFIHSVPGFKKLSPAQKITSSFLLMILSGALLLILPISNRSFQFLNWLGALFTAISATCVARLNIFTVTDRFNWFGQLILLLLIQIGGLGLMTFMTVFILIVKNRLSMNEKIAMKETLNQDRIIDMREFLLDILYYTLFFEAVGAILISFCMIPHFGLVDGSFKTVFPAVSAFCNAGFDTLGSMDLQEYVHDPLICLTIIALIVLGDLGFTVWFGIRDKVGPLLHRQITFKKFRHSLSLRTKVVLSVSLFLITIPGLLIMLMEFADPRTLGDFNIPEKLMTTMFESMAPQTAGFIIINYAGLKPATDLLMIIIMFIDGPLGGTAGGIKATTIAVLVTYIISSLRGREHTVVLHRKIGRGVIIRAMEIFFINLVVLLTGIFLLNIVEQKPLLSLSSEAVSAIVTIGSGLGIITSLDVGDKLTIIFLMYVGHIGISTLILLLTRSKPNRNSANKVSFPNGDMIVG